MALNTGQLVSVDIEGAPASLASGNRQDTCPLAKLIIFIKERKFFLLLTKNTPYVCVCPSVLTSISTEFYGNSS